jgi:RNA polymerase sigma-70 factor (ECF subfamily)
MGPISEQLLSHQTVRDLRRAIRRIVGPDDVDDVLHEVFVALLSGSAQLSRAERPVAFLAVVATNLARLEVRRRARRLHFVESMLPLSEAPGHDGKIEARQLLSKLERLDARDREVVRLRHLERRPLAEVGALTGMSLATVKRHLARSSKELRAEVNAVPQPTAKRSTCTAMTS